MTWKEFKETCEAQGIQDTDEIEFIDVHGTGVKVVRDDEHKTVQVFDEY